MTVTIRTWTCLLVILVAITDTTRKTTSFQFHVITASFRRNLADGRFQHTDHTVDPIKGIFRDRKEVVIRVKGNDKDGVEVYNEFVDMQRRKIWTKTMVQIASLAVGVTALLGITRPVYANNNQRSRTSGYQLQKSENEWKEELSPMQYYILREGGTERPGYSILEKEKRPGTFKCAGCGTPLFQSTDKFNSGTGWPSFARGLSGVEVEQVNPIIQLTGAGAELRCRTCGGHLGDVFNDGYLFIGTEAALTGQRYCIDGAALVFYPNDEGSNESTLLVRGDIAAAKSKSSLSSLFDPPVIQPRD